MVRFRKRLLDNINADYFLTNPPNPSPTKADCVSLYTAAGTATLYKIDFSRLSKGKCDAGMVSSSGPSGATFASISGMGGVQFCILLIVSAWNGYLALSDSLKLRWLNHCLDDSCISSQDWENHPGQKHQSQFVHIPAETRGVNVVSVLGFLCVTVCVCRYLLHTYKHYQCHQDQAACAIDTHVVGRCFLSTKQNCCWDNVCLVEGRQ